MFSSIRVRLTLWYLLVFGTLLICFSAYVYSFLSSDLRIQFDLSLRRTAETMANYFTEFAERKNVVAGAQETVRELKLGKQSTAILRSGKVLASNGQDILSALASASASARLKSVREPILMTNAGPEKRLAIVPFEVQGTKYMVAVLEPMDDLSAQLARVSRVIFFALPAALLVAAASGFLLARHSLKPVVTISEQAAQISASNLDQRLKIKANDELGRLAAVFNALLSRLEGSFRVMREFIADASHELRTPLAIINGEADVSLARERTAEEYRDSLSVIRDNCKRMALIVTDMLALARADSGERKLRLEELYLNDLIEGCCRSSQALAAIKGVNLAYDTGEDISFRGDEELLKRMAVNLLDNAIRYTPAGGAVSVKVMREDSCARLIVSDSGIGIPPECVGRVFDRFYRVVKSRSRADGGSGLGLSIVKLAAESHGGSVQLVSEAGSGSTFTVNLPLHS